ncbi:MAG: T9SS type A sorting domain-containing protein [Candidatus Latescibacterota bacterium]
MLYIISIYNINIYAYEISRTDNGSIIHWVSGQETYQINANGGPVGSLPAIQAAAQTWSDVPTSSFTFIYGGTTSISEFGINDGINIVSFGPLNEGTVGLNYFWYNAAGAIVDSDLRFNTIYLWGTNGSSGVYDVQSIATHEFGHSLSLADLYDITDAEKTMYGYTDYGETKKRTLHQDDIDGITYIYPRFSTAINVTSPNGGESWTAGTTHNITWTSSGVTNVELKYSVNNGSSWTTIVASTAAATGSYAWTVPAVSSAQCLVRVSDASNATIYDQSNGLFTIQKGLFPPSNLTVSDVPNDQGHSLRLTWTASPSEQDGLVSGYRIYRSRTNIFNAPLPLSQFSVLDSLIFYEQRYTILIDSVSVGAAEYIDPFVPLNEVTYYYWVQTIGKAGASKPVLSSIATLVEGVSQTPQEFKLGKAYPNPFNPSTAIEYTLPRDLSITLEIYNISGQKVATLDSGRKSAGKHTAVWNARGFPSGLYFYTLRAEGYVKTGKALLMK